MTFAYYNGDRTDIFGVITAPVILTIPDWAPTNRVVTLGANALFGSTLTVSSDHATYTLTLDLSASNYALSATDITVGTRGILIGRASMVTSSGNWDSVNGTFYQNTSSVLMNAGGYAKLSSTQQFHNLTVNGTGSRLFVATGDSMRVANNLTVNSGCSASLQNNSYVIQSVVNNGAITQNSKRLNITGSSQTPLTGYGTFDGDVYLNGSTASSYQVQTGLPMGNLYFDRDTKINLDSTRYLQVVPASTEFVGVKISSIGTEQGYAARWTATSTGPVTYTLTANANELYDIWVDHTTRIGVVQTSADGIVQFTYNGPFSTHEFTVSKSGGPPTSLGASFSYSISGNQVSFTDKSYGGVSMWVWDFGDGTGSTSQSPTHKYSKSGEYVVSLTVYDSSGHSSTAKTTITLKLGPQFPVEPTPKGWNVWVSDKLTVSVSALALLIFGTWFLLAGYFPPLLPLMTPKTKKILGLIIIAIGLYWFVFVDNSHSWLGWGSV
jgi:PKD repeat protein